MILQGPIFFENDAADATAPHSALLDDCTSFGEFEYEHECRIFCSGAEFVLSCAKFFWVVPSFAPSYVEFSRVVPSFLPSCAEFFRVLSCAEFCAELC